MSDDDGYVIVCESCGNRSDGDNGIGEGFATARPIGIIRCGRCGHHFHDPAYDPDPDGD